MKLLLDENVSRRAIPRLDSYFPASTHVCLVGLEQATDQQIWAYATANDFTIVTCDSDFHEMSLLLGAPPKVIWIQIGNPSTDEVVSMLISAREELALSLADESVSFVELRRK
jgi:predicted nuclease of predicted toxin-antitoxin system